MNLSKIVRKFSYIIMSAMAVIMIGAGAASAQIDINGGNGTTGPYSDNDNLWDIIKNWDIDLTDVSDILNDYDVNANTGSSLYDCNTEIGNIVMGDITGNLDIYNDPYQIGGLSFFNLPGSSDINADLTNLITGPNSDNDNILRVNDNFDFDYTSRNTFNNSLNLGLNSGRNQVRNNTVVGDIYGGDIRYDASITNRTGNQLNDFIFPNMDNNISVEATNNTTGPCSDNDNEIDISSNSSVNINNSLSVNNDVDVTANTGENTVGNNTVVGDISTGNVDLSLDIANGGI